MKSNAALGSIRESSDEELVGRIKRLEEELFQSRLKRYTNQLENTNVIRIARREIAQAQTILSARKHGIEEKLAAGSAEAAASAAADKAADKGEKKTVRMKKQPAAAEKAPKAKKAKKE